ncbi:Ig-like domain-containing protein, partial [Pseudovibrio denitrificans]
PFTVTADFSEDVSGFVASDVSASNASVGVVSGGPEDYTLTVTPDGRGDVTLRIPENRAQDSAGNQNTASNEVTVLTIEEISGIRIEGQVFEDNGLGSGVAHDGLLNGNEKGLASYNVSIASTSNLADPLSATTTDSEGNWSIELPDTAIREFLQIKISPASGGSWRAISEIVADGVVDVSNENTADRKIVFRAPSKGTFKGFRFGEVRNPTFQDNQSVSLLAGNQAQLSHRYHANTSGSVAFGIENEKQTPPSSFEYHLLADADCDQLADRSQQGLNVEVEVGDEVCVIVLVRSGSSTPVQSRLTYDVTARTSFEGTEQSDLRKNTDQIVLQSTVLKLLKSGSACNKSGEDCNGGIATVSPGAIIEYEIQFANPSEEQATDLKIFDRVPDFTELFSQVQCPSSLPSGIGCEVTRPGTGDNKKGYVGPLQWTFSGNFQPGAEGAVKFRVRVQ